MRRLLVVDDDAALRRLMRIELGTEYEIADSGEPEQGLALALEFKPDAILLDLRMPKYSGFQLLQRYTSFNRTHTTPVVIVSGEGGAETKQDCLQLGAAAYFEKPVDFQKLRECLKEIAKPQRHVTKREVRLQLRVRLALHGTDSGGRDFEELAETEEVSLSGFLCSCTAELVANTLLDVYLAGRGKSYVGKAQVVHTIAKDGPDRRYDCRFVEKIGPWVLQ
ncbi:MAG: response regulator [Acidobacteriota bacterium]|nr:response regulator [Acidobacteriota bacterium]